MIANAVTPAGEPHGLADIGFAQSAAGVGAITVHLIFPNVPRPYTGKYQNNNSYFRRQLVTASQAISPAR
jgi:hypothetical protein